MANEKFAYKIYNRNESHGKIIELNRGFSSKPCLIAQGLPLLQLEVESSKGGRSPCCRSSQRQLWKATEAWRCGISRHLQATTPQISAQRMPCGPHHWRSSTLAKPAVAQRYAEFSTLTSCIADTSRMVCTTSAPLRTWVARKQDERFARHVHKRFIFFLLPPNAYYALNNDSLYII